MRLEILPSLGDEQVALRAQEPGDVEVLAEFLEHQSVRRWFARETIDVQFVEDPNDPRHASLTIVAGGRVAGWVQISEHGHPDRRHAELSAMLGPAFQGKGIGPVALFLAADWLLRRRRHHRLTIQAAAANNHARTAYRKLGFREVGVQRQAHRRFDGHWEDSILFDLLKGELVDPRR